MDTVQTSSQKANRTRLKRYANRGHFDYETIYAILDEGFVCHLGFVSKETPYVIPTGYGRLENTLYVHGSVGSRMLMTLKQSPEICITVTLCDGLVLARSAVNHSMNYRSVVILGRPRQIEDTAEKLKALKAITEHIIPGRWEDVRPITDKELAETSVYAISLDEASAKIRVGPPIDDDEDLDWACWAGVIPLKLVAQIPVPVDALSTGIPVPKYADSYSRT